MPKAVPFDEDDVPDWVTVAANRHAAERASLIDVIKTTPAAKAEEAIAINRLTYLRHFEDFQAGAMAAIQRVKNGKGLET